MEIHALQKRGWSISAISRHTGFDRKTVRKCLAGDAVPARRYSRPRIRSTRSSTTAPPGWSRIRTYGLLLSDKLKELSFGQSDRQGPANPPFGRLGPRGRHAGYRTHQHILLSRHPTKGKPPQRQTGAAFT